MCLVKDAWFLMDLSLYNNFIFDCDGVLWRGSSLIPNTIETLKYLKSLNKKLLFVTNNSTKSRADYLSKFRKLGLDFVQETDIVGSAYIAALYLKHHLKKNQKVFVIGMQGLHDELAMQNVPIKNDFVNINCMDDMKLVQPDPQVGAVVMGFDIHINYSKLAQAHTFLSQENVAFIATNVDSTFPSDERNFPGTGALVSALSNSTKMTPVILGKPNLEMLNILLEEFDLDPTQTCMIGDRLDTDIVFGKNGNLFTILVLSGVSKKEDLEKSIVKPDLVLESIADLKREK